MVYDVVSLQSYPLLLSYSWLSSGQAASHLGTQTLFVGVDVQDAPRDIDLNNFWGLVSIIYGRPQGPETKTDSEFEERHKLLDTVRGLAKNII